jgi:hypothetical protein
MGTLNYNYNALATGQSFTTVVNHRFTPATLTTDDMLMTDHIATNAAQGEVHSSDTTAADGCLILESTNRIVLKPGFKAEDGALGTYRIVTGCPEEDPLAASASPAPREAVPTQASSEIKEKK